MRPALLIALLSALLLPSLAAAGGGAQWRLAAVVTGGTGAYAWIEDGLGSARRLHRGDDLDGCPIRAIAARGVLLACPGRAAEWRDLQPGPNAAGAGASPGTAELATAELPSAPFHDLLRQPQRLVSEITLKPRVRSGQTVGYEVERLRAGSVLAGHGLIAGDVITGVDGIPVSGDPSFLATVQALSTAHSFRVQFERDGSRRDLPVSLIGDPANGE